MWRVALLPLAAVPILLAVGYVVDDKNWYRISEWLKALWADITNPNPFSPGPFTRLTGRVLGVETRKELTRDALEAPYKVERPESL